MKKKMDEEERERSIRTNEDPYLVGEEAARKNREERLRRENGWGVLEQEDKRWDWLLGMLKALLRHCDDISFGKSIKG